MPKGNKEQVVFRSNIFLMFIFGRESSKREGAQAVEGQRDRERQTPKRAPGSELFIAETNAGLEPMKYEIMT